MTERLPLTELAHRSVAHVVRAGDTVIDATAGNGHDTAFLASLVGTTGKVYAFDIQVAAVEATRQRLEAEGLSAQVSLINRGHEVLDLALPPALQGRIAAAMFNLGYLPGAEKSVITRPATTLKALQSATDWLMPDGILTIIAYPGHPGGTEELEAVRHWLSGATNPTTETRAGPTGGHASPVLFVIR